MSMLSRFANSRFAKRVLWPIVGESLLQRVEGSGWMRGRTGKEKELAQGVVDELRRKLRESLND